MKAIVSLEFPSSEVAESVLDAISPDNSPLPTGLTINCVLKKARLIIEIQCERSIESLGATIEDIMSAIDLSLRTSESVNISK
jgi:tRNA threonylcarbamoyladenosine modification (KEOPS) complex  Pcc1 subunit